MASERPIFDFGEPLQGQDRQGRTITGVNKSRLQRWQDIGEGQRHRDNAVGFKDGLRQRVPLPDPDLRASHVRFGADGVFREDVDAASVVQCQEHKVLGQRPRQNARRALWQRGLPPGHRETVGAVPRRESQGAPPQAKTAERTTVQLIDAYLADDIALIASHAASIETEGDLTTALLLDFPIHLLHDVHPGCAFRGQGGKFNDHRLSQARPWLEEHATQQHEQRPAYPPCTTHSALQSLEKEFINAPQQ